MDSNTLGTGLVAGPTTGVLPGLPTGVTETTPSGSTQSVDGDGDGHLPQDDCNDADPNVFPGAPEHCDGVDSDCDGNADAQMVTTGGQTFSSIQAAVDVATAGDTVVVCPGTYSETVRVPSDLSLVALGDRQDTVIDAGGLGPAVEVVAGAVVIDGFTLTGGVGVDHGGDLVGGALAAPNASSIRVVDCSLEASTADLGGGFYGPDAGSSVLEGTWVLGNVATSRGGGAYLGEATLQNCLFEANEAPRGGGAHLTSTAVVQATDVDFRANAAGDRGGAFMVDGGGVLSTDGGLWDGNTSARYAAGVYLDQGGAATFVRTTFDNNAAQDKGGAVYVVGGDVAATDAVFVGNSGSWGGAVFAFFNSTLAATGTEFRYNRADMGAAVYANLTTTVDLTDSLVLGNVSQAGGGARLSAGVTLQSTNVDWGTGVDDNTPDDVSFAPPGGDYTGFGVGETFFCTTDTNICQ